MAVVRKVGTNPMLKNCGEDKPKKRKVAIYARVSTDHEEQKSSLYAQMDYYRQMIEEHENWEYVETYADDGISGTSVKHRAQFLKMMEACEAGKINLILTKSISRFARNTVDSVEMLRRLRDLNVEVYFQKENIWTSRSEGEFLITLLSSLAQEESRSISQNTTWGRRKQFAEGRYSVAYSHFLGYDKGMKVNPEEAAVVRMIYRLFLEGFSPSAIGNMLEEKEIPAPAGGSRWSDSTIHSVLANEKYKGDALLQKTYREDFLTKKIKKNTGELNQYYITAGHEAIIDRQLFDYVQEKLRARAEKHRDKPFSCLYIYSEKIVCGTCGESYRPLIWHADTTRDPVWACANRSVKGIYCRNPHIYEKGLDELVRMAMQSVLTKRPAVLETLKRVTAGVLTDDSKRAAAMDFIDQFAEMPRDELPLDMDDFALILKRITVWPDRTMTVELLDGTETKVTTPVYGPQRGWLKEPRVINEGEAADPEEKIGEHWNHGKADAWDGVRCRWCGKPVTSTPGKRKKMYCDDECRKKWWSKHRTELKGKTVVTKTCPCCGKEFRTFSSKQQKYCSQECYRKMRWGE
ncbi:MAG: recombinase family protein [Eubacterium sp.]